MRVLQVVKTTTGGAWAAWQAGQLTALGIDVHVALPSTSGLNYADWLRSGATIHIADLDFPSRAPWRIPAVLEGARRLVDRVQPDVIHSHFIGTTLTLRQALGRNHAIPRVYQVAGPLHLEHAIFRAADIRTAGPRDYWICTSRCIQELLAQHGVDRSRLFLSYYGWELANRPAERTNAFRSWLGIGPRTLMVGNISWLYAPKYYLGQRIGLKGHEHLIEALGSVVRTRPDVVGVLVGGAFAGATWYEERLRRRALEAGQGRILMPGPLSAAGVGQAWPDFDCAIHAPLSENCGGVLEPLYAGVPTIGARVGGVPELVIDEITGKLVPPASPAALAEALVQVLGDLPHYRILARRGHELVKKMFDVERTTREVADIYRYVLGRASQRPAAFDSARSAAELHEPIALCC
ncbi:MAG: glycosyltransferase [Luteitalea sp.]|nr:glycosyltransferase [Luteitalea sp.]